MLSNLFTVCIPGTFGPDCLFTCNNCQNGAECTAQKNGCICKPGWQGVICDKPCDEVWVRIRTVPLFLDFQNRKKMKMFSLTSRHQLDD